MSPLRLGVPEAGPCLPSDWGSQRQGRVSPQTGGPRGRALSPLRLGSLRQGCVSPQTGLPEAGLCLPSDWGSLRWGCVSLQTGAPSGKGCVSFSQELCGHFIAEVYFAQGGGPEFQESEISGMAVGLPGP